MQNLWHSQMVTVENWFDYTGRKLRIVKNSCKKGAIVMKLRGKITLLGVLPIVALALIVSLLSNIQLRTVMTEVVQEDLMAAAKMEYASISNAEGNAFSVDSDGNLMNGTVNLTEKVDIIDEVSEETGVDVTVFYGDTRYVTSVKQDGERVLGTKAADVVIDKVLKNGEEYFASNVDVVNEKYYAYYIPVYDGDGTGEPVGMIFAGKSQSRVNSEIMKFIGVLLVADVILVLICVICISFVTKKMSMRLKSGISSLEKIADGDLVHEIGDELVKGNDETSEMVHALKNLKEELITMVSKIVKDSNCVYDAAVHIKEGADNAQSHLEQVDRAIGEIAEGATSQASDTQNATTHVIAMGERISETNENVQHLTENANKMEQNGLVAKDTLKELENINAEVQNAIDVIYDQTNTTNDSAKRISEAISLITSIAEETNLLALNASIEAARAGEQGRGFAVVASQIQSLAEQSNASAVQISEYIRSLMKDSENAVATMEQVKETMQKQIEMVEKTDDVFVKVMKGIKTSREDVDRISSNTKELDESRNNVIDIVQSLSAVSEEYAASTEETSASASQVSNTVQDIAEKLADLQQIAVELKESVDIFKIE